MTRPIAGDGLTEDFAPARAVQKAVESLGGTPCVLLVFTGYKGRGEAAALEAAQHARGAPVVVVEGAGALSSGGECEGAGVSALALGGDGVEATVVPLPGDVDAARAALVRAGHGATLLWLALTPPLYRPDVVGSAAAEDPGVAVVGGGAARTYLVGAAGDAPRAVEGVGIALRAPGLRAAGTSAPAARILTEWRPLTEVNGQFLVSAGAVPMVEWIASTPGTSNSGNPTFVAVRAQHAEAAPLLRTVAGIDPRRGVAVSEPIEKGTEVALGVWEGDAAREELARRMAVFGRELGGGTPVAAILMTCLGRGVDLFGAKDVDIAAVRARFGSVPLAGMFSQFEIARFDGAPRMHLYTASLAVLYRPS
jgi:small ligand-binding sensory domain FIST